MGNVAKFFVILGIVFILIGLLLFVVPKVPFLGKLPGDIYIKKENFTFYFPITTCIVLSILFSLILSFFR
ncbi:MAG: DUF2905 domain-containing protein [Elusimicrobia bacterium]|nr:DUF2905 domain-containing protein [Elusimicrobiota bacterium]